MALAALFSHCSKPSFVQVPINVTHYTILMADTNQVKRYHNNQGDTVLALRTRDSLYVESNTNSQGMTILQQSIAYHWQVPALNINFSTTLVAVPNANGIAEQDIFEFIIQDQVNIKTTLSVAQNVINCVENCTYVETMEVFGTTYNEVITAAGVVTPRLYYNQPSKIFAFETLDGQLFQLVN